MIDDSKQSSNPAVGVIIDNYVLLSKEDLSKLCSTTIYKNCWNVYQYDAQQYHTMSEELEDFYTTFWSQLSEHSKAQFNGSYIANIIFSRAVRRTTNKKVTNLIVNFLNYNLENTLIDIVLKWPGMFTNDIKLPDTIRNMLALIR